ncbi:dnaJ homolog subfamily C member 11-like [Uloborus diversus]|uniref:dnaJ homolog subfamily C member 11-like n=1 Tax=Uloborus diversus TaxID=327109 RepID=UPI002408F41F|nr:dnaJ homolog subfamily C member 11-like [Uloborus diversus]
MANFMPPDSPDDLILEDDYYALLNLEKSASADDITNSYRRLSKLYHPDKHLDPVKKKNAEILFNKIKTAYEVLNDPHQRAIYDTLGIKGLETEGWQIVERTKTAQEIREEYELLVKEREERKLQQRTNPKGVISVGVNATDLFETYDFEGLPALEISSMTISQSVEAPLSVSDTMVLNGSLTTQNGTGAGNVACTMKKVISSNSWIEYGIGAGNGLGLNMKGFRNLSKRCFGTLQTSMLFANSGLTAGFELMLARQLDKQTAGYLTWKKGHSSSVNTMVVHDAEKCRFVGGIQFGVRTSFITFSYIRKLEDDGKLKGSIKFGVFGAVFEYGCEKKVSQRSTAGAALMIGIPSGVTLKLKINRANQTFNFPILLSEEIIPSAIFYGTVTPIVGWYVVKTFIIDPYHRKQKERETEKVKEANAQKMMERKKEALMAVSLMQETYRRIKSQEEERNGLIISQAIYGSAEELSNLDSDTIDTQQNLFDVTVQLQCLVKDSRLSLPNRSKSNLPGFYDPCLGEDKCLRVNYLYRNISHSVTVEDCDPLRIPRDSF